MSLFTQDKYEEAIARADAAAAKVGASACKATPILHKEISTASMVKMGASLVINIGAGSAPSANFLIFVCKLRAGCPN